MSTSNKSSSSLKDMMTSKDWMPKYAREHEDIDYKDMLKSDFADGEKSASEASVASAAVKKTDAVSDPIMAEYYRKIGVSPGNTGPSPSPRINLPSYQIPLTRASSRQSSLTSTPGGNLSGLPSFDLPPFTRSRSRQSSVTSPGGKLISSPSSDFKMSVDIGSFDALTTRPLTRSSSRQSSLASRAKLPGGASNDNFKMSVDLTSLGLSIDPFMSRSVDTVGSNIAAITAAQNESTAAQQILALKELHRKEATEESSRKKTKKEKRKRPPRRPKEPLTKDYVEPRENDVLLGRGGRSNHHVGNRYYRAKTEEMRDEYRAAKKEDKTAISQRLVDWVLYDQKANFLDRDTSADKWYVIHDNTQRRRKASQALREHMTTEEREQKKRGARR